MRAHRQIATSLRAALTLVFLSALWIVFAPIPFGGQVGYVIIAGTSMEPGFHRGDLVIIRQKHEYQIGDVVTYRHPTIGPIIHRIIDQKADRFVFKGDNNSWIDEYQPRRDELIGALWMYLPSVGKTVEQLRHPINMAIFSGVLGLVVAFSVVGSPKQRRNRRRRNQTGGQRYPMNRLAKHIENLVFVWGILAFAALALAVVAWTRPTERSFTEDILYQQQGVFRYTASAPPGLYDADTIKTGDPVFWGLTPRINLSFTYQLTNARPHQLTGTYRLNSEIRDINGWRRTIELQPETTFSGSTFTVTSEIDLGKIRALIDTLEEQTKLVRAEYTFAVIPQVQIQGTLADQVVKEIFAPQLEFRLDELQLHLAPYDSSLSNPLAPSTAGLVKQTRFEANTISLLGLKLEVEATRWLSLTVLTLALVALGFSVWKISRTMQGNEAAWIRAKYAGLLIQINDSSLTPQTNLIEVASIDDLARLAERDSRMILHTARAGADYYFIQDVDVTYCYQSKAGQNTSSNFLSNTDSSARPEPLEPVAETDAI